MVASNIQAALIIVLKYRIQAAVAQFYENKKIEKDFFLARKHWLSPKSITRRFIISHLFTLAWLIPAMLVVDRYILNPDSRLVFMMLVNLPIFIAGAVVMIGSYWLLRDSADDSFHLKADFRLGIMGMVVVVIPIPLFVVFFDKRRDFHIVALVEITLLQLYIFSCQHVFITRPILIVLKTSKVYIDRLGEADGLQTFLSYQEGFTMFFKHLTSEFSAENLLFVRDVGVLRQKYAFSTHKPLKMFGAVMKLYNLYFRPESPLEVNVSAEVKEEIDKWIAKYDHLAQALGPMQMTSVTSGAVDMERASKISVLKDKRESMVEKFPELRSSILASGQFPVLPESRSSILATGRPSFTSSSLREKTSFKDKIVLKKSPSITEEKFDKEVGSERNHTSSTSEISGRPSLSNLSTDSKSFGGEHKTVTSMREELIHKSSSDSDTFHEPIQKGKSGTFTIFQSSICIIVSMFDIVTTMIIIQYHKYQ